MSKERMSIRPVRAEDEAIWVKLWGAYLDFYRASVPEEVYKTTFARLLSGQRAEPHGLIAFADDEAVGLTHYILHRSCWKVEEVCYLQDLFTVPEARGMGVGRALIEAVYAAADAAGAPAVYWLTQEFNYQGRMLYDRIGTKTPFIRYNRAA
ncbi:MAG: GNAT family N-acetyltransferase [Paracoccaceae bacterium]